MDITTLGLAKQYATQVAAGYSSVSVQGNVIHFILNDGTPVDMTVPMPADGVSILNISIDEDGSLLCHMSDGKIIDAGFVPSVKGDPGKTPIKGVDYWTPEEQNEIKQYIDNSIGTINSTLATLTTLGGVK